MKEFPPRFWKNSTTIDRMTYLIFKECNVKSFSEETAKFSELLSYAVDSSLIQEDEMNYFYSAIEDYINKESKLDTDKYVQKYLSSYSSSIPNFKRFIVEFYQHWGFRQSCQELSGIYINGVKVDEPSKDGGVL